MKTFVEHHGHSLILKFQGKIDTSTAMRSPGRIVEEQSLDGIETIILDLEKVTYMDSSGIGDLVEVFLSLKKRGKSLCLTNLESKIRKLMELTQLATVFPIYDSNEAALKAAAHESGPVVRIA